MNKENNEENQKFLKLSKITKEKGTKKLVPLNDHAFKRMFGEKGCEPQLITLLNGLTNRTGVKAVKKITIEEKKIPREDYGDKEIRLDVLATSDKGEQFNIEAQLRNVDMGPRGVFYAARLLTKSVKKGQNYEEMKKVIMIIIFGTQSEKRDNYKGYCKHDTINKYTEKYEFVLPKFDSLENKDLNNPQHRCLMFLSHKTDEKMREKVMKMEPKLAKAQKIMDHINRDTEEKELYEMRELVKMDIKNARKNDIEEGIGIGKEEGIIKVALNSIKENIPIKTIIKITGLPTEKIQKLKEEYESNK